MWLNLPMNHHHFGYTGWIVRRPMMHACMICSSQASNRHSSSRAAAAQKMRIRRSQVIPGRERTTNEDDGRRGSRLLPRPKQQQQQRSSYHHHPQLPQISPSSPHCFCLWGRCHGWSQQGRPLAPLPRTTSQLQHDQFAPAYDLPLRLLLHSWQVCILLATHHHLQCSDLISCASFFPLFFWSLSPFYFFIFCSFFLSFFVQCFFFSWGMLRFLWIELPGCGASSPLTVWEQNSCNWFCVLWLLNMSLIVSLAFLQKKFWGFCRMRYRYLVEE